VIGDDHSDRHASDWNSDIAVRDMHTTRAYASVHYANSMSTPASSDAFVALTLGRSANAIELLVPPAPPIQSAPDLKARCFDFLSDLLLQHCLLYYSLDFWLVLPQTVRVPSSSPVLDEVAKRLSFATPTAAGLSPPVATTALTVDALNGLDAATFAALGTKTSTDLLSDYSPACYPLFSAKQLQQLVLRSARVPPAAPTASSISPRTMHAVLASAGSSCSSYFGSLDFLDSQCAFDAIFPHPVPLFFLNSSTGVTIDSISLSAILDKFLDRCKFHLFLPIFRSDYVGTFARDDAASLQATISALKKITMNSRNSSSGAWVNLHPDEVFAAYSNLIPLLPFNVSVWGLNLVTQYFDALSGELQDALHTDPTYLPPDISTLGTRSSQLEALRYVCVAAVRQNTLLRNQEKLIAKTVNRK
jgi:hypothetical protein